MTAPAIRLAVPWLGAVLLGCVVLAALPRTQGRSPGDVAHAHYERLELARAAMVLEVAAAAESHDAELAEHLRWRAATLRALHAQVQLLRDSQLPIGLRQGAAATAITLDAALGGEHRLYLQVRGEELSYEPPCRRSPGSRS
jgi:hypothetical protein